MSEALLKFFVHNDMVHNTDDFEKIYEDNAPSIYEVIRVKDGVPLFLEEHYERLINSSNILNHKLNISMEKISSTINKMISLNNIENYNIKIVINNLNKEVFNEYYFFIKSNYPNEALYSEGIKTFTYKAVRENPNAKVINNTLRSEINRLLKESGCYEALLVNEKGEITEGSRSNTFFIKNNKVYTAPAEGVLLGITRQRIIKLCKANGIEVVEEPILSSTLNTYEALFMSGTSPKVLPISKVDDLSFDPNNKLLKNIMKIYDEEINMYIKEHK